METESLIEVYGGAHLSAFVDGPYPERAGIMNVAPPASFKSAMITALDPYPNALVLSDLTIRQAARLREDMICGKLTTLAFEDFEKLFQRAGVTAENMRGFIKGITAQGYGTVNWEDSRAGVGRARCLVIGGMTRHFYSQHFGDWLDDGFARRFIWSYFQLGDPWIIVRAIAAWKRLEFSSNGFHGRMPTSQRSIPMKISDEENAELIRMIKHQPGQELALILLKKILAALRWKFSRQPERPMQILRDFATSLNSKEPAILRVSSKK